VAQTQNKKCLITPNPEKYNNSNLQFSIIFLLFFLQQQQRDQNKNKKMDFNQILQSYILQSLMESQNPQSYLLYQHQQRMWYRLYWKYVMQNWSRSMNPYLMGLLLQADPAYPVNEPTGSAEPVSQEPVTRCVFSYLEYSGRESPEFGLRRVNKYRVCIGSVSYISDFKSLK